MPQWLKQSTTITLSIGPFVDKTDGVTEEIGLAGTMTANLSKNGGALAARNSATAISYDSNGNYLVELNTTDTNTLGRLRVQVNAAATHLPVWQDFMVVPANVWDSMFGADLLQVDVSQVGGTSQTAGDIMADTNDIQSRLPAALVGGRIDASVGAMAAGVVTAAAVATGAIDADALATDAVAEIADGVLDEALSGHTTAGTLGESLQLIRNGTAQAGAAGTITLDAGASASDNFYNNTIIQIVGGTGIAQSRIISGYVGATKVATVNGNWVTTPDATSAFVIRAFGSVPGASAPTAGEVADAVWDEARAGHVAGGSFGEGVASVQGDVTGSAASVTAGVTVTTNNDKTGYALSAAGVNAVADQNWDEARADHTSAGSFGQAGQAVRSGTAQAGGAATITLDAGASGTDDYYINQIIFLVGGTGAGQSKIISDYMGATKVATVNDNWATQPDATSVFVIYPFGSVPGATAPTAGQVADAVWDEARAGHVAGGSFGEGVASVQGNVTGSAASVTGAVGSVTGAVGSVTAAVTVGANNDKTGYGLSAAAVQAIWDALTTALVTAGSIGKKLADWVIGTTQTADVATRPTLADIEASTVLAKQAKLDTLHDTRIPGVIQPQTGDSFARLGAPAGVSVSADVAAVKAETASIQTDTNDIQTRLPAALVGGRMASNAEVVTDKTGYSIADATSDAVIADAVWNALKATYGIGDSYGEHLEALSNGPAAAAIAAAVWNALRADYVAAGSFGQAGQVVYAGTATAGGAASITLDAGGSKLNDYYKDQIVWIVGGAGARQSRRVVSYVGATGVVTVDQNWVTQPDATSVFLILPDAATGSLSVAERAAIADKLLGRAIQGGADGGRSVTSALRSIRNKVDTVSVPGSAIIYQEDDVTEDHRRTLTTDASAEPIVTADPTS